MEMKIQILSYKLLHVVVCMCEASGAMHTV